MHGMLSKEGYRLVEKRACVHFHTRGHNNSKGTAMVRQLEVKEACCCRTAAMSRDTQASKQRRWETSFRDGCVYPCVSFPFPLHPTPVSGAPYSHPFVLTSSTVLPAISDGNRRPPSEMPAWDAAAFGAAGVD